MDMKIALDMFNGYQGILTGMMEGLPCERLAEQPPGVVNHPAWTVGHLAVGIDMALELMGEATVCPAGWSEKHAPGNVPSDDRSMYAGKDELMERYNAAHAALVAAVGKADEAVYAAEMPVEAYREFFPTIGHAVMYMLMSHEPAHVGQVAVWRRAAGLMPAGV